MTWWSKLMGIRGMHWVLRAVEQRLREELALLHVTLNEDKSRLVDLAQGECFGFLGFAFRRIRSRNGHMATVLRAPTTKRTALLKAAQSHLPGRTAPSPSTGVIQQINPMLRGWVQLFCYGPCQPLFLSVRDWVEKRIRRHLMRARQRPGFGWKRWSRPWLYQEVGPVPGTIESSRPTPLRLKALPAR